MARQARVVIPGYPHHVTHRGNRRQEVFFCDDDRRFYLEMLRQCAQRFGVQIWAYCLMGNHVHLIAVPQFENGLARCIGLAHQRYAAAVNARRGWTGSLWAGRYFSTALDEDHLWTAVRYVELNPVRARLVEDATGWEWSSAGCHGGLRADALLAPERPFPGQMQDWPAFLEQRLSERELDWIRRNTATGRPTGSDEFIERLEADTGRVLRPQKPGPKSAAGKIVDITEDMFG